MNEQLHPNIVIQEESFEWPGKILISTCLLGAQKDSACVKILVPPLCGGTPNFTGCGARRILIEGRTLKLPIHESHASAPQSNGNF